MAQQNSRSADFRGRIAKLFRNPYFWGALFGLLAIPAMRPLFRHVPEPPAVSGMVPAFSGINQQREKISADQLRGGVYVLSFIATPTDLERTVQICRRFAQHQVRATLVSVFLPSSNIALPASDLRSSCPENQPWQKLTNSPENGLQPLIAAAQAQVATKDRSSWSSFVFIVDHQGRFRGAYGPHREQTDEILHRTVHVVLDN